jgi:hypothetical protein
LLEVISACRSTGSVDPLGRPPPLIPNLLPHMSVNIMHIEWYPCGKTAPIVGLLGRPSDRLEV